MQLQQLETAAATAPPVTLMDRIDEAVKRGDYTPEAGLIIRALQQMETDPADMARRETMVDALLTAPSSIDHRLH